MSKGVAFSERQVEQLTEILDHQRQLLAAELKVYVDQRFIEERATTRTMIQAELADIKDRLERVETRLKQLFETEDEDVRAISRRLTRVKAQVTALERSIAKLQLAD